MPRLREPKEKAKPEVEKTALFGAPDKEQTVNKEVETENGEVLVADPPEKKEDEVDAAAELRKRIEQLQKAEQIQRERAERERQEKERAIAAQRERDAEISKLRTEGVQSRADLINKAIESETEAAAVAERELASAMAAGDFEAAAKAQRRISRAESQLVVLQNGKAAIEAEIEEAKARAEAKPEQRQQAGDNLDNFNIPDTAKRWLRAHPEFLTDPRKNAKIQSLHWDVVDEGHEPFSDAYYASLETHLGMRKKETPKVEDEEEPERTAIVSAPVSREVPTNDGKRSTGTVRLTAAQREAAKMAGITETEYAKQLQKLNEEKASGNYGAQR